MSIYLSRLLLNPRSRRVISELTHPYEMHRTLMRAFPSATDDTKLKARDEFGVLFRADVDDPGSAVNVLVQSLVEPDWSFLDGQNYLCADTEVPPCEHKDIMPACQKIQNGRRLRFRLRANVCKRVGAKGDPLFGKRVAVYREEAQRDWLIGRGRSGGYEPIGFRVGRQGEVRSRKNGRHAIHFGVTFDGTLRVSNAHALVETMRKGIGPAKAFGFGLLSLARA